MLDLIIDKRASCYVIGGTVSACSGNMLKLKGEVPLQVTGGVKETEVFLKVKESVAGKITFVQGMYIAAMVKPDNALDMLWEGAELDISGITFEAFYVKTGGEIKMPEKGRDKEKSIFIGEAAEVRKHRSGYDIIRIKLYDGQIKNMVCFTETDITPGKRCVFLSGKGLPNKNGTVYYPVEKQGVI